ncbi:unnamed protein product [Bursaphelenchus okinawaensis]|uniref:ubiquitinyl hydrolase 1 n=1 Tax=Bursaphelenchus okinawaensis TaxID=465554 RepID=A0A811LA14_9BILA|nr:unnamed protein product [Bursaphelenchus okinawaensis]CAG9119206.1 unnamed protein product [Bursaphelenchus okinawaensis]
MSTVFEYDYQKRTILDDERAPFHSPNPYNSSEETKMDFEPSNGQVLVLQRQEQAVHIKPDTNQDEYTKFDGEKSQRQGIGLQNGFAHKIKSYGEEGTQEYNQHNDVLPNKEDQRVGKDFRQRELGNGDEQKVIEGQKGCQNGVHQVNGQEKRDSGAKKDDQDKEETEADLVECYKKIFWITRNRSTLRIPGLTNFRNNCFMNAALQALLNTTPLLEFFCPETFSSYVNIKNKKGTRGKLAAAFMAIKVLYCSGDYDTIHPFAFYEIFKQFCPHLCNGDQQDASEFLAIVLNYLHEDMKEDQNRTGTQQSYEGENIAFEWRHCLDLNVDFIPSPILHTFYLVKFCERLCKPCQYKSLSFELESQIRLNPPTGCKIDECTLFSCLDEYFGYTNFEDSATTQCQGCHNSVKPTKSEMVWSLPSVLVFTLNRFVTTSINGRVHFTKNRINVAYPEFLDMKRYVHRQSVSPHTKYRLYAVTEHNGTINTGHYTTIFRKGWEWVRANDSGSSRIEKENVQTRDAYLLYYCRLDRLGDSY